ncbi:MAG TPA: peptidylprolyl isomerase, partial [Gemmataceae bacterium]
MRPGSRTGMFALAAVVTASLGGGSARPEAPEKDKPAAVVNGETISLGEVDAVIRQRPAGLTPLPPSQQRQLRLEILAGLIDDLLLRQFLREHAPPVDPAELDQQMAALVKSLQAQDKTMADYCRETHQTPEQVREGMLAVLQLGAYARANTSEAELRKYYQANKDYFDKVTVRASHVVLRVPRDAPAEEREQARRQLAELREQIVSGKLDFAEAAKQYSHCPSAPKGGDIGYFTRKWMVDEAFAAV